MEPQQNERKRRANGRAVLADPEMKPVFPRSLCFSEIQSRDISRRYSCTEPRFVDCHLLLPLLHPNHLGAWLLPSKPVFRIMTWLFSIGGAVHVESPPIPKVSQEKAARNQKIHASGAARETPVSVWWGRPTPAAEGSGGRQRERKVACSLIMTGEKGME